MKSVDIRAIADDETYTTWGMLCPGMVFIPTLALGNYFTQKRSITRQMRAKTTSSVSPDSK